MILQIFPKKIVTAEKWLLFATSFVLLTTWSCNISLLIMSFSLFSFPLAKIDNPLSDSFLLSALSLPPVREESQSVGVVDFQVS
jgi:hypothetical protein